MNRHRSRARRGYTLVFFAMFLFGFMALAALVIDVGFARLTQRQMQTAVDAAALEGLRFRDQLPANLQPGSEVFDAELFEQIDQAIQKAGGDSAPPTMYDMEDPDWRGWTERARRWLAQDAIQQVFRDPSPEMEHQIRYGAGPQIELDGGFGPEELAAGQNINLDTLGVWKPALQLNVRNHGHGDVVAMEHDPEGNSVPVKEGTSPQELADAPALQVVLRRTNNFSGLDDIPHVSSHGPTIPYLFGRGAFLPAPDPNTGYAPRHHGMTVRATAIADGTPALSAGRSRFSDELPGTLPFAIERPHWDDDVPTDAESIIRVTGARIELLDTAEATTGKDIGFVIDPAGESELRSLGDQVQEVDAAIHAYMEAVVKNQPGQRGYVVLIGDSGGAVAGRVIGFGYVDGIAYDGSDPDLENRSRFVMIKRTGRIAAENASAVPVRGVDSEIASKLIQENRKLAEGLLVPINRPTYGRRRE